MAAINVVAADGDNEARRLFTTTQQAFTNMHRGRPGQAQPPIDDIDEYWTPQEKIVAGHRLMYSFVGAPGTVRDGLDAFVERTATDELMIVANVFDHAARVRSYELLRDGDAVALARQQFLEVVVCGGAAHHVPPRG